MRNRLGWLLIISVVVGCGSSSSKKDDWAYTHSEESSSGGYGADAGVAAMPSPRSAVGGGNELGFAVGGAKGIENFRENIEQGYLPLADDLTCEGLYYDYYFDTGKAEACSELFCPSYSQMAATDPLTGDEERFLSVGLNSGLTTDMFKRKTLNLVVVLDISGSMSSPFDQYYYDPSQPATQSSSKSKMTIANEALVAMVDHLEADDYLGVVLFESDAHLGKPLSSVGQTDMEAIKSHILQIQPRGGTNMEAGYEKGTALFSQVAGADPAVYENRIIFLTDAMPNTGATGDSSLLGMVQANAQKKIYTTFIGVGVDFNSALVERITKVQGANYYAVHSEEKFKARMDEEFDFMVTPLVFDLQLVFSSGGFSIDAVYGSPEADQSTGVLMRVNTLFPSKVEAGQTKGGIVILKLEKTGADNAIDLVASYEDREEKPYKTAAPVTYDADLDVAPNTGIRKAILLARYVRLMKEWIVQERALSGVPAPEDGQWERSSLPLSVDPTSQAKIKTFLSHFKTETAAIGDKDLDRETQILTKLANL